MSPTTFALAGFILWTLALLVLMEAIRSWLVVNNKVAANDFVPDNGNLSPFMQRLARAHANCLEGLPVFGGLMILAVITSQAHVTDPLAFAFLGSRVVQSVIHLSSLSAVAVTCRFLAFAVQMAIGCYWGVRLLVG